MSKIQHWEDSLPSLIEKREKYKTFLNLWFSFDRKFQENEFFIKIRDKKIKLSREIEKIKQNWNIYKTKDKIWTWLQER